MSTYERLSVQDRLHLDIENRNVHTHVAGAFVLEAGPLTREGGGIDIDRIRDFLDARLFLIPHYRQRIAYVPVERHPVWIDDPTFNIEYHVRHARLPLPGDERQLKRLIGRIVSQQLDRGKPLWELWMVEGLGHDRVAVVAKVHHCMVDGIASVDLMQTLLSFEPVKTWEPAPAWLPRPAPESRELLEGALRKRLGVPFKLGGALLHALREPSTSLEQVKEGLESLLVARGSQATPVSDTPFNLPIGPHRRLDWLACDLEAVKRIKRSLGGTVNQVVLATVAGAIGTFLEQRGVTQHEQQDLEFRVACPVSTRPDSERGRLGNRVSSLMVPLPVAERDPRRRLAAVREIAQELRTARQDLVVRMTQTLSEWTWPGLYSAFTRAVVERHVTNLTVSNVPGPADPLYLLGARLFEAYPLVPLLPDQGLGIACLSYAGGLFWGFNADRELMPDLHDFVTATDRSFRELSDAAEGGEA